MPLCCPNYPRCKCIIVQDRAREERLAAQLRDARSALLAHGVTGGDAMHVRALLLLLDAELHRLR